MKKLLITLTLCVSTSLMAATVTYRGSFIGAFAGDGGQVTNVNLVSLGTITLIHTNGTFTNVPSIWFDNVYTNLAVDGDLIKLSPGTYYISNSITARQGMTISPDPLAQIYFTQTNVSETTAIALTNYFTVNGGQWFGIFTNRYQSIFRADNPVGPVTIQNATFTCPNDVMMFDAGSGLTTANVLNNVSTVGCLWDIVQSSGSGKLNLNAQGNRFVTTGYSPLNANHYNEVFSFANGGGSNFISGNILTVSGESNIAGIFMANAQNQRIYLTSRA